MVEDAAEVWEKVITAAVSWCQKVKHGERPLRCVYATNEKQSCCPNSGECSQQGSVMVGRDVSDYLT